jgi:electron transport complex protein RnfB
MSRHPSLELTPAMIDAVLPQTQCGLCTYAGCLPYAEALVAETAPINLCPPGGVAGLQAIAKLVGADPAPFMAEMAKTAKPPLIAVIREAECIGCTKCIQACPVDAIAGASKAMHTIISQECTGCELCIAPCPVDCIDLLPAPVLPAGQRLTKANLARERYQSRENRLRNAKLSRLATSPKVASSQRMEEKKAFIQAAIARSRLKKRENNPSNA